MCVLSFMKAFINSAMAMIMCHCMFIIIIVMLWCYAVFIIVVSYDRMQQHNLTI